MSPSSSSSSSSFQDRSLLVVILEVTPSTWGERDKYREFQDKTRMEKGKSSIGPARLEEILGAVQTFLLAFAALHRENGMVVVGVAGDEVAVLYPRKGLAMDGMVSVDSGELGGSKIDPARLHEGLILGVAELAARSAKKVQEALISAALAAKKVQEDTSTHPEVTVTLSKTSPGAAITSATSLALCLINRFMVTAGGGVSALSSGSDSLLHRREDAGVLEMIAGGRGAASGKKAQAKAIEERMEQRRARGMLSPRILVLQASEDRTRDYNAFMNCAFAAAKGDIVMDGCFIPSGINNRAKTSTFLEQACDRTGGVFSKPTGTAQINGAMTEIMMTLFLSPLSTRNRLNLPKLTEVDFRARCFQTGESVDQGYVCNQCLSIFKNRPSQFCFTCGAHIKLHTKQDNSRNSNTHTNLDSKRQKLDES